MRFSKKKSSRALSRQRRKRAVRRSPSVLDLVRSGVERFILNDANMMSFRKMILRAAKKGENSPHPLTGAAFRRIVKKAIRDRKLAVGRGGQKQAGIGRESAR